MRFEKPEARDGIDVLDLRPVYVVGIGLDRHQPAQGDVALRRAGLTAVREALRDAAIGWPAVESVYDGTALLGMAPTRAMLRYLGATGIAMAQVENASASGSTAFRQACLEVASGLSEVALALGVDKPASRRARAGQDRLHDLVGSRCRTDDAFCVAANEYMHRDRVSAAQVAAVGGGTIATARAIPTPIGKRSARSKRRRRRPR